MTRRWRPRLLTLGFGLLCLALAWRLAAPGTPPLYDGPVALAPYRYVCIPSGYAQQHAAAASTQTVKVTNGAVDGGGVFVSTSEAPVGQVQVLVNGDDIVLTAGATSVVVSITPQAPPTVLPSDGRLNGNVYTVTLTSGGQPLTLKPGKEWTVVLRGPANQPTSLVEQDTGAVWKRLATQPVGQPDIYAANSTTFVTFALVIPGPPGVPSACRTFAEAGSSPAALAGGGMAGTGGSGVSGSTVAIAAVIAGLITVGSALLILRRRRSGDPRPH